MLVQPSGASSSLRGDLIVRAVLRSDLTPIPQTIELEVREAIDTEPLKEGTTFKAGRDGTEFIVVKSSPGGQSGNTQGDRPVATRKLVGIIASCAAIARPLTRSVVRYGATLGDIYRACGAQVQIESDFTVPVFTCYKGMTPSFEMAKALQEEAGALVLREGKVQFKRLSEMLEAEASATLREDSAKGIESQFLQQHAVPFGFTTAPDNALQAGRAEGGNGATYRPRGDARILNNLATALIMRRKVESSYAPHLTAGMRMDIGEKRFVVITAAHAHDAGADGDGGRQETRLWLGELVKP